MLIYFAAGIAVGVSWLVKKKRFTHLVNEVLQVYFERLCGEEKRPDQSTNFLKPKAVENLLRKAADALKGNSKRIFIAQTIEAYGHGGQSWAEEHLLWNRGTIRKGNSNIA